MIRLSRLFVFLALSVGTLFQATSCSTLAADAFSQVSTSITTNLIRREVYRLFNVSSSSSLGSLSSLTSR